MDDPRLDSWQGKNITHFQNVQIGYGAPSSGRFLPCGKDGWGVQLTTHRIYLRKKERIYTSTPTCLHSEHMDNFTFIFISIFTVLNDTSSSRHTTLNGGMITE
jgi:hypothetical protein